MGTSSSKEITRKRTARESWYAPVSRSTSAPIHYVADLEADSDHLPLTPAGSAEDHKSSLASLLQEESLAYGQSGVKYSAEKTTCGSTVGDDHGYVCEPRKRVAISRARPRYNAKLNPVTEVSEWEIGDSDTINTSSPMRGLIEDDRSRESPPMKTRASRSVFEKSQSFNKVHGLDSCFTELDMLDPRRCFSDAIGKEVEVERLASIEESEITSTSPAKSQSRRTLWKSPEQSPLSSPSKSPTRSLLKSPWMGSSSPLFDPSLLAKFELAADATALSQDDCFTFQNNEGSMTTSLSSFYNRTSGLSDTSSDGESPQSTLNESSLLNPGLLTSWSRNVNTSCELDNFEFRCPPKGEDKLVLYFTSLRGVRKTYEDCCVLRRILQGLGVHVDERDVWMHSKFREELTQLLDNKRVQVPRLFVKGRYIGGAEEIFQLHEDGLLADLIVGIPCFGEFRRACEGCADVRFVPCVTCHGSCKVLDNSHQVRKCRDCNENGLMLCPICN